MSAPQRAPQRLDPEELHEIRRLAIERLDGGATDFETWFVAQHGGRLYDRSVQWLDLENKAHDAERVALKARHEADAVRDWDNRREVAFSAWNARQTAQQVRMRKAAKKR